MSSKFKKIILLSVTVFVIFSFYSTTHAQNSELGTYTVLAPLPGIQDGSNKTDLQTYLPNAFNLAMGVAAVMAFVMITFGGIMYVVSDSLSGKTDGRKYVEDAVLGLLLVIGAWVILNTINPAILKFNLDIKPPNQEFVQPAPALALSCYDCVSLGNLPLKPGAGTTISPTMLTRLNNLNSNMQGTFWRITEAFPPTEDHRDLCHRNGTCIDANVSGSPSDVSKFIVAADAAGLNAVYEVKTEIEKQRLVSGGVPSANILVLPDINGKPQITAPHFSVYIK